MPEPSTLDGALAVVTGASGNLGPVWIGALAEAGATVVGIDIAEAQVPGAAWVEAADVTDREALAAAAARVKERAGVPTVLVNNAGVDTPPGASGGGDFLHVLDVNVVGAFNAAQVFGETMADAGRGSIVNIGSLYATIAPIPELYDHFDPPFHKPPAYGASKAALVNLTRYLARLWGPSGVRVNALSPGGVAGGQDEQFVAKFSARVPLGRMAVADDLVGPLLFLASDASRYVTGQNLQVDGGFTA